MREDEAQRYFHQLINIVDHCHSKGVSHREKILKRKNPNPKIIKGLKFIWGNQN